MVKHVAQFASSLGDLEVKANPISVSNQEEFTYMSH